MRTEDEVRRPRLAFGAGAPIGVLGGLIGLGGAEFRLPVLRAAFRYSPHRAVALNLAVSAVTLVASLILRLPRTNLEALGVLAPVAAGMAAGSMFGSYVAVAWTKRMSGERLEQAILVLLVVLGGVLVAEAFFPRQAAGLPPIAALRVTVAVVAGLGIGIVSSMLGVAGGEIIIPTLVLAFGADIKTAGTAAAAIGLLTVVVGCLRHRAHGSYRAGDAADLIVPMGAGSVVGAIAGALLLPWAPATLLKVLLGLLLIASALKVFFHRRPTPPGPPGSGQ